MSASYTINKSTDGKYFFNLEADNNEKVLTSETYHSKQGALDGIASVRNNSAMDSRYERKTSTRNQPYFILKAANGEPIGRSEEYSSIQARERGIQVVKTIGPKAPIRDLTN